MSGSLLLEKIKIFVSDDALLKKFMKLIEKLCKTEQCANDCNLCKTFCWSLKDFFFFLKKKDVLLDDKKKNFMGQCISYSNVFEFFAKEFNQKIEEKCFFFMI